MTQVSFILPEPCSECGAQNSKINGVIYNDSKNYFKIRIRCMRCGEIHETIKDEIK